MNPDIILRPDSIFPMGEVVFDRVDPNKDLRVIMDSRISFTEHIEALLMLRFVKRLSSEFRDPSTHNLCTLVLDVQVTHKGIFIPLRPFMCHLYVQNWSTQVVCGCLFMTCMSIELSVFKGSSLCMRCEDWDGWVCIRG
jgi:hypothetical protein